MKKLLLLVLLSLIVVATISLSGALDELRERIIERIRIHKTLGMDSVNTLSAPNYDYFVNSTPVRVP